ncbi:hypothetical protein MMC16_001396 [Acarospora aff. strigata]|nr:hypothetical protein [Acarospora aff. strigata]
MWSAAKVITACLSVLSLTATTVVAANVTTPAPSQYGTLSFKTNGNVTRVTFNNPPINLVNARLVSDLYDFITSLRPENRTTPAPKVVIFDSANPDFFLGHIDLNFIILPTPPDIAAAAGKYVVITQLLQSITSTIFIAEINGRAFGAGHELSVQMDMRFAGPKARAGPVENALGLFAGAGGQLFLGQLVNKGRALEYALAAKDFDGPTGAALGWFNSYHESQGKLTDTVNALAQRIALFPVEALNQTKSVLSYLNPAQSAFASDAAAFALLDPQPVQQGLLRKMVAVSQNQTRSSFELGLTDTLTQLYE